MRLLPNQSNTAVRRPIPVTRAMARAAYELRPATRARPWSDCHQITAEVGDRVWSQKFAQPIRHPTLRDAAEVNARSGGNARLVIADLEHVGQRRQGPDSVERRDRRSVGKR